MERPLRRDAAERRAALLSAARDVFAEDGIDAPLNRIAERAGVGRATLYRNFPGRAEIALAVLLDDVEDLEVRFAGTDAPQAFPAFLEELSVRLERNLALGSLSAEAPPQEVLQALRQAIARAGTAPLRASQAAGVVRADVTPADLRVLTAMLGAGLKNAAPHERRAIAKRTLQFVLDAVRAPGRGEG